MRDAVVTRRTLLESLAAWALMPREHRRPSAPVAADTQQPWGGEVLQADEGELLISGRRRAPMRIKVDSVRTPGVAMSMLVSEVAPGAAIPIHLHQREDELIFIHSGRGMATLGERRTPVAAGAMLYVPRQVWHGIENTGHETITWCATWSPPGFEQYFKAVGVHPGQEGSAPTREQAVAIGLKYGMVFKQP